MSTLVYLDHKGGNFKKAAFEALGYATKCGGDVTAIVLGDANADSVAALGKYGATKVLFANNEAFNNLDAQLYTKAIVEAAQQVGATNIIFSFNNTARAVAPRVAARLQAGIATGVIGFPNTENGFVVATNVFSGKAMAHINIKTSYKVISITPNSFPVQETGGTAEVVAFVPSNLERKINVISVSESTGRVPLPEAELVVSGGRGLKGPENWGILEDLASAFGAEMACSRPVADSHWRPHHEHVGQTGGTIRPNLYVAVGISGAIQHLAGVNGSKTIVVINKDPEAPFFKAGDYGICADAFDVLPVFTESVKKFKASLA
jgi:electron transfer flavoprotein alpha subunit